MGRQLNVEVIMKLADFGRAIRQFYRTTTLHGFKYLNSKYYSDRVGWAVCCCASACCAGVLCAVLWARFLQVPALLTLKELRFYHAVVRMPLVAVCPAPEIVARAFLAHTNMSIEGKERLPTILARVLQRKPATMEQLELLETVLAESNTTLAEFLFRYTPTCRDIIRNCRWQTTTMPCLELFQKELTQWGVCCVMRPYKMQIPATPMARLEITRRLHLGMQCSNDSILNGCEFYTKFEGEEWVAPVPLTPGLNYFAQMTFVSVLDSDPDKLVDATCSKGYTRSDCLLRCTEYFCGCSDPLRSQSPEGGTLMPCSVTQLNCLRTFIDNSTCPCLPPCTKVSTFMALETSPIKEFNNTFDKIYSGLNETIGIALSIRLRISGSRIFSVIPTETWITLLSSLGGVFNMFLGVGLFSALEFLFLIIVKLPIAVRRNSELSITRHGINLHE